MSRDIRCRNEKAISRARLSSGLRSAPCWRICYGWLKSEKLILTLDPPRLLSTNDVTMAYQSSYHRVYKIRPLTNNTVLITGAASGIGRSLCPRLGERGASLALIDRDGGALNDLGHGNSEMARVRFRIAVADVRDRPGLGQAVDALVRELGPIDILVASAGVCGISARR